MTILPGARLSLGSSSRPPGRMIVYVTPDLCIASSASAHGAVSASAEHLCQPALWTLAHLPSS